MMEVLLICPFCGAEHSVMVEMEDYLAWQDGELAQNAFPYLSATEREQLISHICPACQEKIFGVDEEDEDEDEGDDIYLCMTESLGDNWW